MQCLQWHQSHHQKIQALHLQSLVKPHIAIITNIGPAHLENLPILSNADLQYSDDSKMIEHINHSAAWKPLVEQIYISDIGL